MSNINKLIDLNLTKILKSRGMAEFWMNFDNSLDTSVPKEKIASFMEEFDLITIEPINSQRCDLTTYGYNIASGHGWIKEIEIIEAHKQKEIDKFNFEYSLAKWQKKTFWWVFFGGLASFIYSSFDLVNTYINKTEKTEITTKTIQLDKELLPDTQQTTTPHP